MKSDGREWGRKAILAGWLFAMAGVIVFIFAMMRAPQDAGLFEALFTQGFLGGAAAVLLLGGVATWIAGNVAFFSAVGRDPRDDEKDEL